MAHRRCFVSIELVCALAWALPLACGTRAPLDSTTPSVPDAGAAGTTGNAGTGGVAGTTGSAGTGVAAGTTGGGGVPASGAGATAGAAAPPSDSGTATCGATCATSLTPDVLPARPEDVMAAMVGRWQFCSGGEHWHTWAPPDVVGVEFTPPNGPAFEGNGTSSGDVYYLVAGADGSPVRGSGNAYHLRYDLVSRNQVDILTPQGSAFFANLRYSSCPRQLELQLMYKPKATLHVPIVDGDRPVPPPLAACPSTSAAAPAMSADDFCAYFLADCGTNYAGYASFAECASSYEANTIDREICQSYHVCNAHVVEGAARAVHCPHAAGLAVCTQTR